MAMAFVIFFFAQKAQGAVISVTSISSAPTVANSDLYFRGNGRVGDVDSGTKEFTLIGTTTVGVSHRFVNTSGSSDNTTRSNISMNLITNTFTLTPVSPSGTNTVSTVVSPVTTSTPNVVYVWATSSGTTAGNLLRMMGMTLAIDGNSEGVGDLIIGDTQPDFDGYKVEFSGNLTQVLWSQEFFNPASNINPAIGDKQQFHVLIAYDSNVPEPSSSLLFLTGSILLLLKRNRKSLHP